VQQVQQVQQVQRVQRVQRVQQVQQVKQVQQVPHMSQKYEYDVLHSTLTSHNHHISGPLSLPRLVKTTMIDDRYLPALCRWCHFFLTTKQNKRVSPSILACSSLYLRIHCKNRHQSGKNGKQIDRRVGNCPSVSPSVIFLPPYPMQ
jgi:hypothetical protein